MSTQLESVSLDVLTNEAFLTHLCCRSCPSELSVCGYVLAGLEVEDEAECVVCIEMAEQQFPFCARCGADWREAVS